MKLPHPASPHHTPHCCLLPHGTRLKSRHSATPLSRCYPFRYRSIKSQRILWGPPTSEILSRKWGSCKDESFGTLHEAVIRKQNPNRQHHLLLETGFFSSFIPSFIFHSSHFNSSLRASPNLIPIKLHTASLSNSRWQ